MSPVSQVNQTANTTAAATGRSSQALSSDEFMKIMITELTNQDPFEPMKNQDLLNQMATMQQMESNQTMSKSFTSLMSKFDQLLLRDQLSAAGKMVGQTVTGKNLSGQPAYGKVVAVNITDNDVVLELDSGDMVKMTDLNRLGGQSSTDIIGQVVKGVTLANQDVVGTVQSMDVGTDGIMLNVLTRNTDGAVYLAKVPMDKAGLLNKDSAGVLIGKKAEGFVEQSGNLEKIVGQVVSYRLDENGQVLLNVTDGTKQNVLPLNAVNRVTVITK